MDAVRGSKKCLLGDGSGQRGGADGGINIEASVPVVASGGGRDGGGDPGDSAKGVAETEEGLKLEEDCVRRLREIELPGSSKERAGSGVPTCFCDVTKEMVSMEAHLQLALVGSMTGSRLCVMPEDIVRAAEADVGVPAAALEIFRTGPSLFLIKCVSVDVMDQLIAVGKLEGNGFCLDLKRWSREEGSTEIIMGVKVQIRITGLLAHAWNDKFVRSAVEEYCWVEAVHMSGFLEGDMSNAVVDAWTGSVEDIPPEKDLAIPEPLVGAMLEVTSLVTPPWSIRKLKKYPIRLETEAVPFSPLGDVSPDRFGSDSGDDGCPTEPFCWSSSSPGYQSLEEYDSDREPYAWRREGC